jgi:hypothetical protein
VSVTVLLAKLWTKLCFAARRVPIDGNADAVKKGRHGFCSPQSLASVIVPSTIRNDAPLAPIALKLERLEKQCRKLAIKLCSSAVKTNFSL